MERINRVIKGITVIDRALMEKAQRRLDSLTKPQGSLGRLEELARLIVGITRQETPDIKNKVIFTLAADHGIAEEGVSAYPKEVTAQMVYNFLKGGAGINVLARHAGGRVVVVDMGVASKIRNPESAVSAIGGISPEGGGQIFKDRKIAFGTKNMTKRPAMTRQEAIKSIETGIELAEEEIRSGADIIGTGDMGIGNTAASTALAAVFTNNSVEDLTGRGTGIDDAAYKNKIAAITTALKVNRPDPGDAVGTLSKVGGFEIGGLAGIILGAASRRIPVVIDGFISGAAALTAFRIEPKVKEYLIASHCSAEKGHRIILEYMGLKPLLDLNLRLGEGTGAALGMNIIEAAVKILNEMATFKEAGVSGKN